MIEVLKHSLWSQFGASLDAFEEVIRLISEELWKNNNQVFYTTYHTAIMLDYYLTIPPAIFKPALPFTILTRPFIPEGVIGDMVPDRRYSLSEILDYVEVTRGKCHQLIGSLSAATVYDRFKEDFDDEDAMDYNIIEILLYNMRHLQHHTGQLNLLLRQHTNSAAKWKFRAGQTF